MPIFSMFVNSCKILSSRELSAEARINAMTTSLSIHCHALSGLPPCRNINIEFIVSICYLVLKTMPESSLQIALRVSPLSCTFITVL
jgi:hypothetical protein